MSRPRFGYLRVLVMLKREGWQVGKKRVYRLYRLEGLQLRMRKETVVKGKGSGKAAVDGAAASGASAGTQGGKTVTVWTMTVIFKNGTTQTYQQGRNPGLHPGDVVTIQEGIPRKYVP